MDELAAAAAVAAMSIDDEVAAEQEPLEAVEAQAAADVLRTIDGNTGEWRKSNSPSRCPFSSRGARSLNCFTSRLTSFGSGPVRRCRAGRLVEAQHFHHTARFARWNHMAVFPKFCFPEGLSK